MNTLKEAWKYVQSDYYRYYGRKKGVLTILRKALFGHNHCFRYSFWLRMTAVKWPLHLLCKYKLQRHSEKYGIQISPKTQIGYGLYIGHGIGIVINGGTRIGNNCNISHFLSIGTNHDTPAVIGDNVYIGPHVSIVEDVQIGDNVIIGAGAVVVKDIPSNSTAVGNPARVVGINKSTLLNPWTDI